MTSITKKKDLLKFINNEVIETSRIDIDKILKLYSSSINKTVKEINEKFKNIENIDINESIVSCTNLIFHIFWNLISYTNNIKLTIFLSDRALLLFTEFITMSRNPILNKDLNILPNINDAISFSYKKTIGPLKLKNNEKSNDFSSAKHSAMDIKLICQKITNDILNENSENIKNVLENICQFIYKSILKFYSKYVKVQKYNTFIFNKINDLFDEPNINNSCRIQILKTIIDLFPIIENKTGNDCLKIINGFYNHLIECYINKENENENDTIKNFGKILRKKKIYTDCKIKIERLLC